MAGVRKAEEADKQVRRPPATTPEGRENQLIALAYDEAERLVRNHEASSQIITYLLKAGTAQAKLEQEKLRRENLLLEAKVNSIDTLESKDSLAQAALDAFRGYAGETQNGEE